MSVQPIAASARRAPRRQPASLSALWHNKTARGWIYQVLVVGGVLALGAYLIGNAQSALAKQGISTGYGFLSQMAGFDIGESLIAFSSKDTFLRAYGVALLNTMKISIVSILVATVIGIAAGVGRMSRNYLVAKLATIYVEVFRNTPQLVQLVFWYTLITNLPRPKEALSVFDLAFLSNRGLSLPWLADVQGGGTVVVALIAAAIVVTLLRRRERRLRSMGGAKRTVWPLHALILFGGPPLAAYAAGANVAFSAPALKGFNFIGGTTVSPEFLALLLGLSLYIGAFIAEIVRSGIQSVGQGQIEAAKSIGLGSYDTHRKVVFPQALRVIVPPATVQYVSILKNSSLGVAVGYPELFSVNNTIATLSGHSVEAITIMMSIYLGMSFLIAALMNLYNRLVQIKER